MTPEFEWDPDKEAANLKKHGVSFTQAAAAFRDPFAVDWIDDRADYGEERVILLGMTDGSVLVVSIPNEIIEHESSPPAGQIDMSKKSIFAKMHRDGTLVRIKDDGTEEPMPVVRLSPRSDREIEAAALADPDTQR